MSNLLSSLSKTVHASLALAIILFLGLFYQKMALPLIEFLDWVQIYTRCCWNKGIGLLQV